MLRIIPKPLLVCLLLLSSFVSEGQENYCVTIQYPNTPGLDTPGNPLSFKSQTDAISFIRGWVPRLQEQGFLAASLDSLTVDSGRYTAYVHKGSLYQWAKLDLDSLPAILLVNTGIRKTDYSGQLIAPGKVRALTEQLLSWCENSGYPFARIWLDSVTFPAPAAISAVLKVETGKLRRIDSIIIEGDVSIRNSFVTRYLDLAKGSVYSEKKLRTISTRLAHLPFISEQSPWRVRFRPEQTIVTLALREKKANQVSIIAGLMPDNQRPGKLLLTADAQLSLKNALSYGEELTITYQNLQYRTPRIQAAFVWPYVFGTEFSADGKFDFFRNNLLFRRTTFVGGIRYGIGNLDYLKLFFQTQSNRLVNPDTLAVLTAHRLPDNLDIVAYGAGIELNLTRTDYLPSPHKGWQLLFSGLSLQRKVIPNGAYTSLSDGSGFDFGALYDTVTQTKNQFHLKCEASLYLPLNRYLTLKTAYSGAYIIGDGLRQNELFMIGGFKLLRGFNEWSIFCNQYHLISMELRAHLSRNSFAYVFSDNALVTTRFNGYDRSGLYSGLGTGVTLEMESGMFNIGYALGHSEQVPFRFKDSKILIGYQAYF